MKNIIKLRWLIAGLWIALTVALFLLTPNLQDLVAEKGQISVPEGYTSQEAQELINEMSSDSESTASAVLVFHDDEAKFDQGKKDKISEAIEKLNQNKDALGISDILAFTDDPAIKEQTVSEDQKTILVPFSVSLENQTIDESRESIYKSVENIDIEHYLTGEHYIEQDIITNSEEGLKKTIFITVGLILVILFIVFKSFVAPFIPLLTVGISYLVSESVVAILVNTINFPLSTFTQIFMVAVMFGIGADYCILLISRFKEEIARHDSIEEAVITTYKSGGKTVFFAGLAVLIGFSTIGLSTFSLYQSAVAVAIGVAVLLIALATLVPFLLVLLGKRLFWPFDKNVAHKESKVWGATGTFAWTRPIIALLIVAVITIPALLTYDNDKSYDSLAEIGDSYGSVIAFNWIADSFGPGQSMPTTVVLETNDAINSPEEFQAIEMISQEIAKMDGVDQVRSATRPAGDILEDFLLENQTELLADGINQSTDGLKEIQDGLQEGASELQNSSPQLDEAQDGVNELMQGTKKSNSGIGDISSALTEIQNGIKSGSQGAGDIKVNLQTIKSNLDKTIAGNKQLLGGYQDIAAGLADFGGQSSNLGDLDQLIGLLTEAKRNITLTRDSAIESNPELAENEAFLNSSGTAIGQIDGAIQGIEQIQEQLGQLASAQAELQEKVIAPFNQLNDSFNEAIVGQEQLAAGIGELSAGVDQLQSGLNEAADGQGQVVNNIPNLQDGLSQIYGGQEELKTAFKEMQDQLGDLSGGLNEGSEGLEQINDGLSEVQNYLGDFDVDSSNPVVIIPEEALENDDFINGIKPYLSDNKKITKFDVILTKSPYSIEAIEIIDKIDNVVNNAKVDTIFEDSVPKLGGISSTNNDLQNISDADYSRTAVLMVSGIFIVLVILLKSIIMPIYLVGSLILTYFTSMAFTELIFVNILGHDGITWAVPFFAFVMLIALGIDYSIFLMDRFNEFKNGSIKDALLSAMKNMGTVIISATVILGGTFAAMLPSGVLSLLQIATAVIIGLSLYAFVMLPLFTPVMVRLFGKNNWWPFKRNIED